MKLLIKLAYTTLVASGNINFALSESNESFLRESTKAKGKKPADDDKKLDLIEIFEQAGNFNILLAGLDAVGLTNALRKPNGPYTFLVPDDDAFSSLPQDLLECLTNHEPKSKTFWTQILTYQANEKLITSSDIFDGFTPTMLNGEEVTIAIKDGQVTANGITFNEDGFDVKASNGVIHILNGVLIPPYIDIGELYNFCNEQTTKSSKGYEGATLDLTNEDEDENNKNMVGLDCCKDACCADDDVSH
jgi:uncharacterized surface protein with fasciclin (FAS1) repeats